MTLGFRRHSRRIHTEVLVPTTRRIPLRRIVPKGRGVCQWVRLDTVYLRCSTPPFELRKTSLTVVLPFHWIFGGSSILIQHLLGLRDMDHGGNGQTSHFTQDGSQSDGGPCASPLTRRIRYNGARFESEGGGGKVIQDID